MIQTCSIPKARYSAALAAVRRNFNRQKRRPGEDALPWQSRAQDGEVGHAKMVALSLNALFGKADYPPLRAVIVEDRSQNSLQKRMLELAQVALLDDAAHILAVVLEDRRKVLLDGDGWVEDGLRCHGDSILQIRCSC